MRGNVLSSVTPPPPYYIRSTMWSVSRTGREGGCAQLIRWHVRTVSLSEEKRLKIHTHTYTYAHTNNNNIYSGNAVCPLRKFLRTRAASRGRKFPLRKTQHTHTFFFNTRSPCCKRVTNHKSRKKTENRERPQRKLKEEGVAVMYGKTHAHTDTVYTYITSGKPHTKTQDSLTLIHPLIRACIVQTQL